ncbi:MAG: hypothetical protein ACRD2O_07185 [Terriglobia bacterium]
MSAGASFDAWKSVPPDVGAALVAARGRAQGPPLRWTEGGMMSEKLIGNPSIEALGSARESVEFAPHCPPAREKDDYHPQAGELQPAQPGSKPGIPMLSRPLSPKRIAANRHNSLKSTGPRTLAGKARSARNSIGRGRHPQERASYSGTRLRLNTQRAEEEAEEAPESGFRIRQRAPGGEV